MGSSGNSMLFGFIYFDQYSFQKIVFGATGDSYVTDFTYKS